MIASAHGHRVVLDETEENLLLKNAVRPAESNGVVLAFGPEGGWTNQELGELHSAGWISATLGNTILRAETAVIAATAIVASEYTTKDTKEHDGTI